jgi:hypothetical protein
MQKQYMVFLLCCSFFGNISAMDDHVLKALSIKRAVSPPLAIPSSRHLMIPQLRDDRGHSDEKLLEHAHSPVRYYGYSPQDPNSLILLVTAASFAEDYSPGSQDDDHWPSH